MIFLGLRGDGNQARLESTLIAIRSAEAWEIIGRRASSLPDALAQALIALNRPAEQPEDAPQLQVLGQLHAQIGAWIGVEALTVLAEAGVAPQVVELAGCQAFSLPGGLALGDLAQAGQYSGLVIAAAAGQESAEECALAAWALWRAARQGLSADPARTDTGPAADAARRAITEGRNPATLEIDRLPTLEIVRLINREDERVARAVGSQLAQIAEAIDRITERMRRGGRLIYVGAGTSGRIGVLDASEIPPTYGASPDRVVALIAGGEEAIQHSLEGVEDDEEAGAQAVAGLHTGENDSVVGIAASGGTPFVLGALREARRRGALTISLACNSPAPVEALAEVVIAPLVGPEVITGSTRMKAGTAQKLTLNMISTVAMVRLGKTFGNLMVDVQTTNTKLRARARRIVAQACGISEEEAGTALNAAGGEVKTAIVARKAGIPAEAARRRLARSGGLVRAALEESEEEKAGE